MRIRYFRRHETLYNIEFRDVTMSETRDLDDANALVLGLVGHASCRAGAHSRSVQNSGPLSFEFR